MLDITPGTMCSTRCRSSSLVLTVICIASVLPMCFLPAFTWTCQQINSRNHCHPWHYTEKTSPNSKYYFQYFTLLTACIFTFPPALSHSCSFPNVLQYQSAHHSICMNIIRRLYSLSVASPKIWNYLPPALYSCNCSDTFRQQLKTQNSLLPTSLLSS